LTAVLDAGSYSEVRGLGTSIWTHVAAKECKRQNVVENLLLATYITDSSGVKVLLLMIFALLLAKEGRAAFSIFLLRISTTLGESPCACNSSTRCEFAGMRLR